MMRRAGSSKRSRPGRRPQYDVFLAYSEKDAVPVMAIGEALRRRGLNPWLDRWHLPPGRPFQDEIERVLPTTRAVAVFVGPRGMRPWEQLEMRAAISQFAKRQLPVIPVLLPGADASPDLPLFLQEFGWVRFGDAVDDGEALDNLEWGITGRKPVR
jgi:hypothetical protein